MPVHGIGSHVPLRHVRQLHFHERRDLFLRHACLETAGDRLHHRRVHQHRRRRAFLNDRANDLHLVFRPLEIALREAVPLPGERQRLQAAQLVNAFLVCANRCDREIIIGIHLDSAKRVNNVDEPAEIEPQIVIHLNPVKLLQRVN